MTSPATKLANFVCKTAAQSASPYPRCLSPAVLPAALAQDVGRLTVVLDIDETLIHTDLDGTMAKRFKLNAESPQQGKMSKLTTDSFSIQLESQRIKVYRRPHLHWFLREASKKFELVTFTAGMEHYGKLVLNHIDPQASMVKPDRRFFRHNCTQIADDQYTKTLSTLVRPMSRVVLVDNNPICFLGNPDNGIPINSFFGQEEDSSLKTLMDFLDHLNTLPDVRPVLKEQFRVKERLGLHFGSAVSALSANL